MSIQLVGINHRTAPIAIREQYAFTDEECSIGLRQLVDGEIVREGLIISTCNRVEVLASAGPTCESETFSRVNDFLQNRGSFLNLPKRLLYNHENDEAVRHVFRVTSSLDSMVIGEPQVLGQIRRAYSIAAAAGTTGRVLNRLVHHALRVAKRVRTETGIAASAVSISYMAVELGRKIFGSLAGKTVLTIGAGEMAELSVRYLLNAGAEHVLVANRTALASQNLAAKIGARAVDFGKLPYYLAEADIVICSTAAEEYVVTEKMAREAMELRRNRPSFFIDISVPRNIDPATANIANLFVFDVDDLEAVVSSNIREREKEAQRAELIIQSEVMQFQQALRVLDIGPTLGALRQKLQDIARNEMARHRHRLGPLSPEQLSAVESMLVSTVNKISHPLIHHIRQSYNSGEMEDIKAWRKMFGVE